MKKKSCSLKKDISCKNRLKAVWEELWTNKLLYAMTLPGIAWLALFHYVPLYGVLIAFKKFNYRLGIWGSPWAGIDNFRFLFNYKGAGRIFFNTIFLNAFFIASGTFCAVALALVFVEIKNRPYKKAVQTIAIFPHFVTWTVVAMFLGGIIGQQGILVKFLAGLGMRVPSFYENPGAWPAIFVFLKIWQGAGYGTIVYVAAITGFDQEMYEAAKIDGASRWQQMARITLPMLKPTIIMLTILGIGNIFRGDFGMIYAVIGDNPALYSTTDVIDTFVYRALRTLNNLGMSTATGLFQSFIGFILVYFTNRLARKFAPDSAIF
ncbi:MAG: ABC transporter permease subunit [Treponema sp.]|jgi:putative aldouronate transport system permease protein|nr:ABC transporter permease subunit [Treponema sp.]